MGLLQDLNGSDDVLYRLLKRSKEEKMENVSHLTYIALSKLCQKKKNESDEEVDDDEEKKKEVVVVEKEEGVVRAREEVP